MTAIAGERGLREASVARVIERAGVSRATFYQLFEDRQACVVAAQERLIARVDTALAESTALETDRLAESKARDADHHVDPTVRQADPAHAWAAALLDALGAEPGASGLLFRAALVNGPGSVYPYLDAIDRWAAAVPSAVERFSASTASHQTSTGPRSGSPATTTELISLGAAIAVSRLPGATAADVARAARLPLEH